MKDTTAYLSNMTVTFKDKNGETLFKSKNSFLSNLFEIPQKQKYKFVIEGENDCKWELKLNEIKTNYDSGSSYYTTICEFEPVKKTK